MRNFFACGAKKYRLATLAGELGAIGSPKNEPLSVVHTRVSQPAVGEPSCQLEPVLRARDDLRRWNDA